MRSLVVLMLWMVSTLDCVGPQSAQSERGGEPSIGSEPDRTRAYPSPDSIRVREATRDIVWLLVVGMMGFAALILGSYLWYQPRWFQLPFRPTCLVRSARGGMDRDNASPKSESPPDKHLADDFDFEYFYRDLEKKSDA